ncbi:hypothetical protein NDU88_005971 [Pleurodeles waltl]|uniref:Uncharacterized protein n=1 Tax=Pleurodeles waltl TaxID=8319 RepID=A0AAV7NS32_PLEWA|nr:hypothetical protein NDU88_005971 [Pleurodeles waltl]
MQACVLHEGETTIASRLWVIDDEKTHIFPSPGDAWTWLHAKGLAQLKNDDSKLGPWLTPQPRERKKSKPETRPPKAQAAESQKQSLREANLFTSPQCQARSDSAIVNLDLSVDQSSGSTSPSVFGPELTPRTADYI